MLIAITDCIKKLLNIIHPSYLYFYVHFKSLLQCLFVQYLLFRLFPYLLFDILWLLVRNSLHTLLIARLDSQLYKKSLRNPSDCHDLSTRFYPLLCQLFYFTQTSLCFIPSVADIRFYACRIFFVFPYYRLLTTLYANFITSFCVRALR